MNRLSLCLLLSSVAATARPHVHHVPVDPPRESAESILEKAANVVPSERQLAFHRLLHTCFVHFGVNTYTGREWGTGMEDPRVFNPGDTLDTDQWCRVAKAAGMRMMLITVKHHDGFCLWQTRYETKFSVRGIPWREGRGDVLRELANSCRRHGLKLGVYLSPADLYQIENPKGLYGNGSRYVPSAIPTDPASFSSDPSKVRADKPADAPVFRLETDDYNRYFMNQLYELLTEYGPIHEVWFDGAHPKQKGGQTYLKEAWFDLIRKLAPEAVIFGGPDVRWCGNEAGATRPTEWNVVPVESLAVSGTDRPDADIGSDTVVVAPEYKVYGKTYQSKFLYYLVPEINTSIRHGWFWRNEHEQTVRSADDVFDIYERAVGGNGVFLLNVPPNDKGRFSERDVAALLESGRRIEATYGHRRLMEGARSDHPELVDGRDETSWQAPAREASCELAFPSTRTINRVSIREDIAKVGQRVGRFVLEGRIDGGWRELAAAEGIGFQRILRFPAANVDGLRLRILNARLAPAISEIAVHHYEAPPPALAIRREKGGLVSIRPETAAAFGWKPHGQGDSSLRVAIHFTTDGSAPTAASPRFEQPFALPDGGVVKALALVDGKPGPLAQARVAMSNEGWKIVSVSSQHDATYGADKAIDGDPATHWHTDWSASPPHPHTLVIDLGKPRDVAGFTYLPRQDKRIPDGMIESGEVSLSKDGVNWSAPEPFSFGNLLNDPAERIHLFARPAGGARFFRLVSKSGAAGKPYAGAAEIGLIAP